jgi:hypothetical protein
VIQSLVLRAPGSTTLDRLASFERDGVVASSFALRTTNPGLSASFGLFDALSGGGAVHLASSFGLAGEGAGVESEESVIHVLGL